MDVSLIILLFLGVWIWSFIALRRKSRKVSLSHTTMNNINSVDTFDEKRLSLRYSYLPRNIHYSNND